MSVLERLATTLGPELTHPTPIRLLALFADEEHLRLPHGEPRRLEARRLSPKDCALAFARAELGPEATDKEVAKRSLVLLGSVSYHVREMRKAKLIKPAGTAQVRGAIRHFYVLTPAGDARHKALLKLLEEVSMNT